MTCALCGTDSAGKYCGPVCALLAATIGRVLALEAKAAPPP